MNKQIQLSILSAFVVAALIGSVLTIGDSMVSATSKKSNEVQLLKQFSGSGSNAECFTENNTIASCNNIGLSLNGQDGSNAGGQQ